MTGGGRQKKQGTGGAYRAAFSATWLLRVAAKNPHSPWRNPRLYLAWHDGARAAMASLRTLQRRKVF